MPKHILVFDIDDDARPVVERIPVPARAPANDVRRPAPLASLDFCEDCEVLAPLVTGLCAACKPPGRAA